MTIIEFEELYRICKKGWKELSKTGASDKPYEMNEFHNHCPACEVSAKAVHASRKYKKAAYHVNCALCPVDVWRERALKARKDHQSMSTVCEDVEYGKWRNTSTKNVERKRLANEISKMKWTYLPQYEKA